MSLKKKYDHIISLGYNCEVSFQFFLKYHFVESALFAWSNVVSCEHLITTLKDLNLLLSKGVKKNGIMYGDIATGISFHGKNLKSEQAEVEELQSRILFLKEKFLKTAQDGKKNLYIFKYPPFKKEQDRVYNDILELYKTLTSLVKNEFDVLIIFEKDFCSNLTFDIPNLYIRRVEFFRPEESVTTKPYDQKGFEKIFSEFVPNFKLSKTKQFKFEEVGEDSLETRNITTFFKKKLLKLIIAFVPCKPLRKSLRRKYHV